jgi:uncharacterized membrane protein
MNIGESEQLTHNTANLSPTELKIVGQVQKVPSYNHHVLLSLILPPVGLFLAWKYKSLQYVLPTYALLSSVIFGVYIYTTAVSLNSLMTNPVRQQTFYSEMVWFSMVLTIVGIVSGFYYRNKAHKEFQLSKRVIISLFIIVIIQYIIQTSSAYILGSSALNSLLPTFNELRSSFSI